MFGHENHPSRNTSTVVERRGSNIMVASECVGVWAVLLREPASQRSLRVPRKCVITLLLFVAVLLPAVGCTVDQKKEVALYRQVLDGPNYRPSGWQAGSPLSLTDALLLANDHNERLAIAGEDYVQAMIDKDRAVSSFLPTVSLVPSYSVADSSSDFSSRQLFGGTTGDPITLQSRSSIAIGTKNWDTPANANWNVFRGFRDYANLKRAASEIERFRALLLDLKSVVLLDVANTYYNVLRSEATVRVLESSSIIQDARVAEMRARDRVGSARKLDVAQAEAQAANTRAQLAGAHADVRNARVLLAYLTAAPVADAPLVDRLTVREDVTAEEAMAYGTGERQDLRAAIAEVRASLRAVQSAIGQYYPSVSLNFNYYLSRMSTPDDSLWNGLLSINLPIFTAGRIRADVRTAWSQVRQATVRAQQLQRQIVQEALTAVENLQASSRRLKELQVAVDAARQALDVAEGNYRAGSGIYLERLVAQDQLLSSQLQLAGEAYNRKLNYLNFLRVTGRLVDPPAEAVNLVPGPELQTETRPTTSPTTQSLAPAGAIPDVSPDGPNR